MWASDCRELHWALKFFRRSVPKRPSSRTKFSKLVILQEISSESRKKYSKKSDTKDISENLRKRDLIYLPSDFHAIQTQHVGKHTYKGETIKFDERLKAFLKISENEISYIYRPIFMRFRHNMQASTLTKVKP